MKKTKTNIPELRFPGFEGEWEEKKLGDGIKELQAGVSVNSIDTPVCIGEYGILKTSAVYNGIFDTTKNKRIIEEDLDKAKISPIPDNIIISRMNTPDLVGECGYVANSSENIFLPDRLWITSGVNRSLFNVKFINYTLNTPKNKLLMKNKATGTSNSMKNITKQDWLLTTIALPIISEQEKIASFLGTVDQKIEQLEKMVALQEKYKKGMMQRIFNQEIRFKSSNGTPFPAWQQKKLGDIGTINPICKELPLKFIYIDLESVSKGQLLNEKVIERDDAPIRAQRLLLEGDIIFQSVRPYQRNNLFFKKELKLPAVASTGYVQIRTKINSEYLFFALHTDRFNIEVLNACTGTSYPAISASDLANIKVIIPVLEEQKKIAGFLSALDEKIVQSKTKLDKVREWKTGLMQRLFI